ncbi:MAG: efflux RND transporter periplasmic adaptor subunit [Desulfomonilaceae bacterium]
MNDTVPIPKKTLKRIALGFLIVAVVAVGLLLVRGSKTEQPSAESQHSKAASMALMGQEKSQAVPGMKSHGHGGSSAMSQGLTPVRYTMSPEAKMLAEVETVKVKRERTVKDLRMVGMVFGAEPRLATLTARIGGRLDAVYIDFTGVKVNKGDPMVTIWSPTLITSEVELITSTKKPDTNLDTKGIIRGAAEKLMQYGLTKEQIKKIRETGKPDEYITLRAPISGIVLQKNALVGQFVKEGTVMYTINDLSHVWVKLSAYEPNLPWIRYGQKVTFTTPSFPGKTYKGTVIFIDPVVDMPTRTISVRLDAPNPTYELKPHMFVNAVLHAEIDDHGRIVKPEWVGKYICPFDPTEISSVPGKCSKSKAPLQPATAYGYSGVKHPVMMPLVVPVSAVLYTGKRSLVYVEVPNQREPTYEQRNVVLGPRAQEKYVIYGGLKEGERVVYKGNFEIDSSVQIAGLPSMMNPAKSEQAAETKKTPPAAAPESHAGHEMQGKEAKPPEKVPKNMNMEMGTAKPHPEKGKGGR